jgi:hypothetical protein
VLPLIPGPREAKSSPSAGRRQIHRDRVARELEARVADGRAHPVVAHAPVLQKPFTAFALLQAVREVLDRVDSTPAVG